MKLDNITRVQNCSDITHFVGVGVRSCDTMEKRLTQVLSAVLFNLPTFLNRVKLKIKLCAVALGGEESAEERVLGIFRDQVSLAFLI